MSMLIPQTNRLRTEGTVVILHAPAPGFMRDRPCKHLGNYFCLCVESREAGDEIYRAWGNAGGDQAAIWEGLTEYYRIAFQPGYNLLSAGAGEAALPEARTPAPWRDRLRDAARRCRR